MTEVRSSAVRVEQATESLSAWRDEIVPSLEVEQRQAESAYQAGEIPLFVVLEVSRRLIDGRLQLLDAEARRPPGHHRPRTKHRPHVFTALKITMRFSRSAVVAAVIVVTACSRSGTDKAAHQAPATVDHPRTEAEISRVRLSADAVKRLGITTVAARIDEAASTRTIGGEVVVPAGRLVVVTAPVAGTITRLRRRAPGSPGTARRGADGDSTPCVGRA